MSYWSVSKVIWLKVLSRFRKSTTLYGDTSGHLNRVLADILCALDTGDVAVLTLLDLSAAFDTVDHITLLQRLKTSYGIGGSVLEWFTSYLSGRIQSVRCGMSTSNASSVLCGVPQGSVLEPILFLLGPTAAR